jgi:hypothetical protein
VTLTLNYQKQTFVGLISLLACRLSLCVVQPSSSWYSSKVFSVLCWLCDSYLLNVSTLDHVTLPVRITKPVGIIKGVLQLSAAGYTQSVKKF